MTRKPGLLLRELHQYRRGQGSNQSRHAWIFRFSFPSCLSCVFNCSLFQAPGELGPLNWESANTKIKREEAGESRALSPFLFPFSRPANFSRAFFFRVFPTMIWEPGTGYFNCDDLLCIYFFILRFQYMKFMYSAFQNKVSSKRARTKSLLSNHVTGSAWWSSFLSITIKSVRKI